MLQSILEDVRREFRMGNMVTRLVIVNIVGFLLINVLRLTFWLSNAGVVHPLYFQIRRYLTLSSEPRVRSDPSLGVTDQYFPS
ncbi:MAG: hypothetical protein IPJ06_18745 [Saprospiraceae bacterium]|nr:hypothetical protein [Saprospiraceae bacterium]